MKANCKLVGWCPTILPSTHRCADHPFWRTPRIRHWFPDQVICVGFHQMNPSRHREPKNPASGTPTWKQVSDAFLRNIPKASVWREKQMQAGLYGAKEYEHVVRTFTGHSSVDVERKLFRGDRHLKTNLVNRAETYALLTRSSLEKAHISKASSHFQALVFLSLCAVLERKNTDPEIIDSIARHINESGLDTRWRLRRSAVWINGLINQLIKRGWNIARATELFFISAFG